MNETKCPDCKAKTRSPKHRPDLFLELGHRVVVRVPDLAAGIDVYQERPDAYVIHTCKGKRGRNRRNDDDTRTEPELPLGGEDDENEGGSP